MFIDIEMLDQFCRTLREEHLYLFMDILSLIRRKIVRKLQ